jgi:hypothetical protein
MRDDAVDGEDGRKALAVRRWVDLNPDRLQYEMVFTSSDGVSLNQVREVKGRYEP